MRAAVLFRYNEPLKIEDIEIEDPKENEVMVQVVATGLCHSDVNVFTGATPVPPPVVAGHEIAGIVKKVGPGVTRVKPGDRVVSAFIHPCGKCRNCISGRENLCETFGPLIVKGTMFDGTTRLRLKDGTPVRTFLGGGFAEYAIVHENALNVVPPEIELEKAAVLGCAGLTGYGAVVNSAKVEAGETVVVIGAGGVGLSVIQWLKIAGAGRIIVLDIIKEKLEKAMELGATDVINTRETDPVKAVIEMTNGGADVVIEAVGRQETEKMALDLVRRGGRIVFIGLPPVSAETPFRVATIVRSGITIIGNYGARPRVDMPKILELVRTGKYDPSKLISGKFKLEEINEAVKLLEEGKAIRSLIIP